MTGRPLLFDAPMSSAERHRHRRDKKHHEGRHVAQLERVARVAGAFVASLNSLSKTYARLEREHGGSKAFASWLKKNKQDVLDADDRDALVALGQFNKLTELYEAGTADCPLSATAMWQWVKEQRNRLAAKKRG